MAMYENHQNLWNMPRAEWNRQGSILEYTIRATGHYPGVSTTFESPLVSPDADPNEYRPESGYFDERGVFHDSPFSMSVGVIPTSSYPNELQTTTAAPFTEPRSPPSPASSEEYHDTPSSDSRRSSATTQDKAETLKRSHTIVERNYRSRLNAKIEALSHQLFDIPSNKRVVKPSKCLVISRATERLEQLERKEASSQREIERLKGEIAVLNHLLAVEKSKGS